MHTLRIIPLSGIAKMPNPDKTYSLNPPFNIAIGKIMSHATKALKYFIYYSVVYNIKKRIVKISITLRIYTIT